MGAISRTALKTLRNSLFPDNTSGFVTPAALRTYLDYDIDSEYNTVDDSPTDIRTITCTIPSGTILNMHSSPQTLLGSPGAGNIIDVLSIQCRLVYGTTPYTTNTNLYVAYSGGSANLHNTAFGIAVGAFNYTAKLNLDASDSYNDSVRVDTPLVASIATGNPLAGDSTIEIYITFRIVAVSV